MEQALSRRCLQIQNIPNFAQKFLQRRAKHTGLYGILALLPIRRQPLCKDRRTNFFRNKILCRNILRKCRYCLWLNLLKARNSAGTLRLNLNLAFRRSLCTDTKKGLSGLPCRTPNTCGQTTNPKSPLLKPSQKNYFANSNIFILEQHAFEFESISISVGSKFALFCFMPSLYLNTKLPLSFFL